MAAVVNCRKCGSPIALGLDHLQKGSVECPDCHSKYRLKKRVSSGKSGAPAEPAAGNSHDREGKSAVTASENSEVPPHPRSGMEKENLVSSKWQSGQKINRGVFIGIGVLLLSVVFVALVTERGKGLALIVFITGLISLAVWAMIVFSNNKKKAEAAYKRSLDQLKRDPTNPNLRQATLQLGRNYSNLMRDHQGHTVFDEVAIMNDIDAATASRVEVINRWKSGGISTELRKLTELLKEGILTDDEWQRAKQNIIGKPSDKIDEIDRLLRNLHTLFVQGVLTESEYNLKKWDVLSRNSIS